MEVIFGKKTEDFVYGETKAVETGRELPKGYFKPVEDYSKPEVAEEEPPKVSSEIYDPEAELASFLYLMVVGQVEGGEILNSDLLRLNYTFVKGAEWELIEGEGSNSAQYSSKNSGKYTWNIPFNLLFRGYSPAGWPQVVIELIGPNKLGQEIVKGYACAHVPTVPGKHAIEVGVFCPLKDSWWTRLKSQFFGAECQIQEDPEAIAQGQGREVISIQNVGKITIAFEVLQRNFERFGYKTC